MRRRFDLGRREPKRIRQVVEAGTVAAADTEDNSAGKQKRQNVAWLEQPRPPDALVTDDPTNGRPTAYTRSKGAFQFNFTNA